MQHSSLLMEGDERSLRQDYEAVVFNTLIALWRRKLMIVLFVFVALAASALLLVFLPKKYTSDALIHVSLGSETTAGGALPAPGIALDPSALIETEARVIRSRAIAHRVVSQLGLEDDPHFTNRRSLISMALEWVRFILALPPAEGNVEGAENLVVVELLRGLSVTNDARSYLIHVAYTSDSPKRSALIANAFAREYLRHRSEDAAARELASLLTKLGPRHPTVVSAKARLEAARQDGISDGSVRIVMNAEPIGLPSGPNRLMILALSVVAGAGLGLASALLLDRRDTGFKTSLEVVTRTNVRCVGMIPEIHRWDRVAQSRIFFESIRTLSLHIGLSDPTVPSKVVLLTSSIPGEGKSRLAHALAEFVVTSGRNCLIVDTSPMRESRTASARLEEFSGQEEAKLPALEQSAHYGMNVIRRTCGLESGHRLFASARLDEILKQARERNDIIIIEAAPILLLTDGIQLCRHADVILQVARWNHTPRRTVDAALQRLRDFNTRVDGVVLSRVIQRHHRRYHLTDSFSYLSKYRKYFTSAKSPIERTTHGGNMQ